MGAGRLAERKVFWRAVAKRAIEGKRRRISIAVNEDDLARLRSEALRTGIPYQTIINSLIRMHVRNEE
jgi:predicted DNA binding CopG/RHH family protein